MNRRATYLIGLALVAIVIPLLMASTTLYAVRSFCCNLTGSQYGYTVWPLGIRSKEWRYTSPIEDLIKESQGTVAHRWVSHAGTQYNWFGRSMVYAHGRPRRLALDIRSYDHLATTQSIEVDWQDIGDALADPGADHEAVRERLLKAWTGK